ncbi:ComEC family competence protein [Falsiruegeria litorea R37]|uniref:ComEC family competence protein n=1 Tax=Falsiruegeria litorea R37 TaxID=1200284 RepID=A0A1Y5SC06_9RHOB|nr:ComEC/Rec2 family competence protein [Falsiruegeria litorea]SLN36516.1 ComEC family competence protein [Falsiruegeria litorea R37]
MRFLVQAEAALQEQRGYLFPWMPVCLGAGIGLYFLLKSEPEWWAYPLLLTTAFAGMHRALRHADLWTPLIACISLISLGFVLAGARAHWISGPVLDWRYYGPVEGRVIAIDRSASDAVRITLDHVRMDRVSPSETPRKVRLSLHGTSPVLTPGDFIMTTGHLSPPQGPVEPGGFDFRRHAWFLELGAVGYTRVPVLRAAAPDHRDWSVWIYRLRLSASRHIQSILPGEVGGFAAAITTGDRSAVSQETLRDLRTSNLAHLLAISGLHMGLLTAFVFGALRTGLSLVPSLALRIPVKKIAAIGALVAAAIYLALSGGNVATERAFVMVAVMLCAVLVDRRALSLRAVAVAAVIVLILRPESLLGPGFQMSFAATAALIAVFGALRDLEWSLGPGWLKPVLGVVISSAVAGLATAPFGAAHFNTIASYGLLANLLSVPLMGVLVIPAAVLAACLAPLGLEWIGLELMGSGLRWILGVAHWVSDMEGAQHRVMSPPGVVLPLVSMGALWLILWRGRLRWLGVGPAVLAFLLWTQAERPDVLIADTGGLIGVLTQEGRALSKPKGAGFIATVWLENDGDAADQTHAASRWTDGTAKQRRMTVAGIEIIHLVGKRAVASFESCKEGQIVVASVPAAIKGACHQFDPLNLRETGSLSISSAGMKTATQITGRRLWNTLSD